MAFPSNIPSALQNAIQTGLLDRTFKQSLTAELGFAETADQMDFPGGIGSTLTFTKMGLLPSVNAPIGARSNSFSDLSDGLSAAAYSDEQYVIGVDPYVQTMNLQLASAAEVIDSLFLQNAYALGESARRSMDILCRDALYNGYLAGNTRVIATLGTAGTAVQVDDVRGFFETVQSSTGKLLAVSSGNPLAVQINGTTYSCTGAVADGTTPTNLPTQLANLTFSGSNSNTSTVPGGYSGVLTLSANASTTNATAGNTVVAVNAPQVFRANNRANDSKIVSGDVLTMALIRSAVLRMRANGVKGPFTCFIDDIAYGALMSDTEFRQYLQTRDTSQPFREGLYGRIMGVDFVRTNVAQFDSSTVNGQVISRPIIVSQGALVQANFTAKAYQNGLQGDYAHIALAGNVAHLTSPPINTMADVIRQTWVSYTGFTCPSDLNSSSAIPTANSAIRKRAAVLVCSQS